jgi:hypothetical protein
MSEEPTKKPTTVTREDLYRQVWETPMVRLAEKYGLSGNGLKKICDRLQVPYPPRGHWAKLAAGKKVKHNPLPQAPAGTPSEATITAAPPQHAPASDPPLNAETADQLRIARDKASNIKVAETLRNPHWAVAAWITKHERERAAARLDRFGWRNQFAPKPFTQFERRQQRILSTLFKEVEKLGYKVKGEAPYPHSPLGRMVATKTLDSVLYETQRVHGKRRRYAPRESLPPDTHARRLHRPGLYRVRPLAQQRYAWRRGHRGERW